MKQPSSIFSFIKKFLIHVGLMRYQIGINKIHLFLYSISFTMGTHRVTSSDIFCVALSRIHATIKLL